MVEDIKETTLTLGVEELRRFRRPDRTTWKINSPRLSVVDFKCLNLAFKGFNLAGVFIVRVFQI